MRVAHSNILDKEKDMKKIFLVLMALFVIFAMINCDNSVSPSGEDPEVPEGQPITISYNANGWVNSADIPAKIEGTSGESIGIDAIPTLDNTLNQRFIGWSLTQDGGIIQSNYKPTKNITLYVIWQALVPAGGDVTITYYANGWTGAGVPAAPRQAKSGDAIGADNLPVLENTDTQIFYGWAETSGQAGTRLTATYQLRGNTNLYVLFRDPVILTFDYNFTGAPAAPASIKVGNNIAIGNVLPAVVDSENPVEGQQPLRAGWLFDGWYTAAVDGTKATATSRFTKDTPLYAQWKKEPNWAWMDIDLTMQAVTDSVIPAAPWYISDPAGVPVAETTFNSDGSLTWKFTRIQQRAIILFSPAQRAIFDKIDEFRIVIDGDVTEGSGDFRYYVGWMGTSSSWDGTNNAGIGPWDTMKTGNLVFSGNKTLDGSQLDPPEPGSQDIRTGSWILQHRSDNMTTVLKIKSIKIRYDGNIGGEPPAKDSAIKIMFDQNYEGAPAGPNPLILDKGGKLGDVYWPKPDPLPIPERAGSTFNGWYTAKTGGTKVDGATDTTVYNANTTLYARWQMEPKAPPVIKTQPVSKKIALNAAMPKLSVVAESPNEGELTYQWYSASNGADKTGAIITGAIAADYTPADSTAAVKDYFYFVKVTNTTTVEGGGAMDATSVTVRVRVYDSSAGPADIELVDSLHARWDDTENALVINYTGGEYQSFTSLPIPDDVSLAGYASLVITWKGYLANGTAALPTSGAQSNDIVAEIFNGAASLGNFGYNVNAFDADTLTYTLDGTMKDADFSGGNGRVSLNAKFGTNTADARITKYVIKSVKFVLAE